MLNNKDAANAPRILKGLLWVSVMPVKVSSESLRAFPGSKWRRAGKLGLEQRDKPLPCAVGIQSVKPPVQGGRWRLSSARHRFVLQLSRPLRWQGLCSVWVTSPSSSRAPAPSSCWSLASSVSPWRSKNASRFSHKSEQTFTVFQINYFDFHK